jgi:hypothetical protein
MHTLYVIPLSKFTVWQHAVAHGSRPWLFYLCSLSPSTLNPLALQCNAYLFLVALLIGFPYMNWRESRDPGALRRGATMLIRTGGSADDDAEPNVPIAPL